MPFSSDVDACWTCADSLHPGAYEHNPSFLTFINTSRLPFKPYQDGFSKPNDERQAL